MKISCLVRAVGELKRIFLRIWRNRHQRYTSRWRGGGTPAGKIMILGTFVDLLEVINHASLHLHMMNSLRASGGQEKGFSLKCMRLLQHCLALPRWQITKALKSKTHWGEGGKNSRIFEDAEVAWYLLTQRKFLFRTIKIINWKCHRACYTSHLVWKLS
jgi:hypothetical protein